MSLVTAIALGLIVSFVVFVIFVRLVAHKTGRIEITAPETVFTFGDIVASQITITSLRACRVTDVRAELHCNLSKLRNNSSTDRESLMYLVKADINVDQDWEKNQSETFDVTFAMPAEGELSKSALSRDVGQSGAPIWTIQARARFGGFDIKKLRLIQTSS